jgi:hypothetical protein
VAINGDCNIAAETNPNDDGMPELYAKWPNDDWRGFGQSVWIGSGNTNRNYAQIKSALNQHATLSECHFYFENASVGCEVAAIGNINSIVDPINYANVDTLPSQSPTRGINYPNGIGLFQFISNYNGYNTSDVLITAPVLPATRLSPLCYNKMFYSCEKLIQPPELPAEDLATSCYESMFEGCSSLIKAPALPALTLYNDCYYNMFSDCTNLTSAPELPSMSLAIDCYTYMFYHCSSLIKVPILKAPVLKQSCYSFMFEGCSSLQSVKILASDISAEDSLAGWLQGDVSSTGKLYYNSKAGDISLFNKPSGWTAKDLYEEIKYGDLDEEKTSVYRSQYMITSGSDSDQNGKGKLDGDGDYEKSFDESNTHKMGTYNPDGSYNQEIWGYKSFNSPVQFRNGIYGDDFNILPGGSGNSSGGQLVEKWHSLRITPISDSVSVYITSYDTEFTNNGTTQYNNSVIITTASGVGQLTDASSTPYIWLIPDNNNNSIIHIGCSLLNISGSILPDGDFDIGANKSRWRNIYTKGLSYNDSAVNPIVTVPVGSIVCVYISQNDLIRDSGAIPGKQYTLSNYHIAKDNGTQSDIVIHPLDAKFTPLSQIPPGSSISASGTVVYFQRVE